MPQLVNIVAQLKKVEKNAAPAINVSMLMMVDLALRENVKSALLKDNPVVTNQKANWNAAPTKFAPSEVVFLVPLEYVSMPLKKMLLKAVS